MTTVAFCEIDPYCRRVLAKHWPKVPIFNDVRELSAQHITAAGIGVDLICGGFPCQDISDVGEKAGIEGARSGLWSEYRRLIEEIKPSFVLIENVAALRGRGLETVLRQIAALGYDAEWHCIPACAIGAPHRRDRIWILAYPSCDRLEEWSGQDGQSKFGERISSGVDTLRKSGWSPEPDVGRVANGVPDGVERLKCVGNAVVPQIPELIGRAIMAAA